MHIAVGIVSLVTTWIHMKDRFSLNGWLLVGSVSLFLFNAVFGMIREIFRNTTKQQSLVTASRQSLVDAVMIDFSLPRPWQIHPGDYIFIRALGIHPLSFAESHPFNIIWWDQDKHGMATRVHVIAKAQFGLSRNLSMVSTSSLRLSIDGPYGKALNTGGWDNFLFVATDIGITAQLPYLKWLIDLQRHPRRLGRVSMIWVVQYDGTQFLLDNFNFNHNT